MTTKNALLLAVTAALAVPTAFGQGLSPYSTSKPLSDDVVEVSEGVVVDIDNDGVSEICFVPSRNHSGLFVLRAGNGPFFGFAEVFGEEFGRIDHFVHFDDDGDGDLDVAILSERPTFDSINVLRSDGGALQVTGDTTRVQGLAGVLAMAAGDLTGNGHTDFVVEILGAGLRMYRGLPTGVDPVPVDLGPGPIAKDAIVDVDGDGLLDLVVGEHFVRRGLPGGALGAAVNLVPTVADPQLADLADMDGDGDLDLVIVDGDGVPFTAGASTCRHFLQTAPLQFTEQVSITAQATEVADVSILDLNGDGLEDVVVSRTVTGGSQPFLSQAGGGWLPGPPLPYPRAVGEHFGTFTAGGPVDGVAGLNFESLGPKPPLRRMANGGGAVPAFVDADYVQYPLFRAASLAVADFDGDGAPEVATTSLSDVALPSDRRLLLIDLDPALPTAPPREVGLLPEPAAISMSAADFSGDGSPDLVVLGLETVHLWINSGSGSFTRRDLNLPDEADAEQVVVGDLNGDGRPDLAYRTATDLGSSVYLALNSGAVPYFSGATGLTTSPSSVQALTSVDANDDGLADLVLTKEDGVFWRAQLSAGALAAEARMDDGSFAFPGGFSGGGAIFGDVNGDGRTDIVALDPSGSAVALQTAGGGWSPYASNPQTLARSGFELADVDLDGDLDVVRPPYLPASLDDHHVLVNDGSGRFTARLTTEVDGGLGGWQAVLDIDQDGDPDILRLETIRLGSPHPSLTVMRNQTIRNFGESVCAPAVANSTGRPATLRALGSPAVLDANLRLRARSLPPGATTMLVGAMGSAAPVTLVGGQGALCLGGSIGRYRGPGQVQMADPTGLFEITLDPLFFLDSGGVRPGVPGATWYFQAWYRDIVAGQNTSNLTDAVGVLME